MKKILAMLLACLMIVGMLAACGNGNTNPTDGTQAPTKATQAPTQEAPAPTQPVTATPTPESKEPWLLYIGAALLVFAGGAVAVWVYVIKRKSAQ